MSADVNNLNPFPHDVRHFAREMAELLSPNQIRFVGGCVRDALFSCRITESTDFDMATDATPDVVTERLVAAGYTVHPTGIDHGTVTAIPNGVSRGLGFDWADGFQITTLRADVKTDGRHADVKFISDWMADASRRDFTINSMSMDPITGVVSDYFGGENHLHAANKVVFVGNPADRIKEDYLRILRMYRFSSVFNDFGAGELNRKVARAYRSGLSGISGERISQEMRKLCNKRNTSSSRVIQQMAADKMFQAFLGDSEEAKLWTWMEPDLFYQLRQNNDRSISAYVAGMAGDERTLKMLCDRMKLTRIERADAEWLFEQRDKTIYANTICMEVFLRPKGERHRYRQLYQELGNMKGDRQVFRYARDVYVDGFVECPATGDWVKDAVPPSKMKQVMRDIRCAWFREYFSMSDHSMHQQVVRAVTEAGGDVDKISNPNYPNEDKPKAKRKPNTKIHATKNSEPSVFRGGISASSFDDLVFRFEMPSSRTQYSVSVDETVNPSPTWG